LKSRTSLSTKIVSLALLNLLLLGATLVGLAGVQLQNFSSLLLAPARDRILSDARLLALELNETPKSGQDELLEKHSSARGVSFLLLDVRASRVAGPQILLPPVVHSRVMQSRDESFFVTTRSPTRYWVAVKLPIGSSDGPTVPGALVIMSSSLLGNPYFLDLSLIGTVLLVVVLISVACWLPLLRGLTRGLSQATQAAEQIAEGRFDVEIKADRC
jgi:two-component system sensor histidine kinase CpxA